VSCPYRRGVLVTPAGGGWTIQRPVTDPTSGSLQTVSLFGDSDEMISLAEIEKVAVLARLLLTPAEAQMMTEQLGKVLEYMSLLNEVNTEEVEPLAHAVELTNVFRDDRVTASLDREAALANAPHRDDECYLVPAVLGEV